MKRFAVLAAIAFSILSTAEFASAKEVMTDRCSADVTFVPSFNDNPNVPGTVFLARQSPNGHDHWSQPFSVKTDDSGHIRWWCHSTTGNAFDPGTWRADVDFGKLGACVIGGIGVIFSGVGAPPCSGDLLKFSSSAWHGWTPERSRCNDHSTRIRAKLGSDRLLQIQCLGK